MKHLLTILLISGIWSCTKQADQPIQLRTPSRPEIATVQPMVNTIYGYMAWRFNFTIPNKAESNIKIWYNWKQKNESRDWTFEATIFKGQRAMDVFTMIDVLGQIEYIRLVKVEGTDRKFNLLHVK